SSRVASRATRSSKAPKSRSEFICCEMVRIAESFSCRRPAERAAWLALDISFLTVYRDTGQAVYKVDTCQRSSRTGCVHRQPVVSRLRFGFHLRGSIAFTYNSSCAWNIAVYV